LPERFFDRLALFLRGRLDVTIVTGAVRLTQRRYAVTSLTGEIHAVFGMKPWWRCTNF
jgi:hypothetical protein